MEIFLKVDSELALEQQIMVTWWQGTSAIWTFTRSLLLPEMEYLKYLLIFFP